MAITHVPLNPIYFSIQTLLCFVLLLVNMCVKINLVNGFHGQGWSRCQGIFCMVIT